ncbi:hypothetical protein PVL29_024746 [Vitis rotundifolia]|uniref:Uncharacterized protein n=1 Tax=Vitis rotundifolia TaxID=103349 RepID=A0AA39D8M4_VITRO|nr:hypothetical protein PVL29_024746 [Vitis rotundifolia]
MRGLNLNFSSSFFTASLPLTQSQIPNPKFPQFQQYSFRNRQTKRCCFIVPHASSSGLPLLPFDINQVLIPSESKTLHLYEARYLALLEEVLFSSYLIFACLNILFYFFKGSHMLLLIIILSFVLNVFF